MAENDKDLQWITVNGKHIPIKPGESKKEAISKAFGEDRDNFDADDDSIYKEEMSKAAEETARANTAEDESQEEYENRIKNDPEQQKFVENMKKAGYELKKDEYGVKKTEKNKSASPMNEFSGPDQEGPSFAELDNIVKELKQDGMWNDIDNRDAMIENIQSDLGYSKEEATNLYDNHLSKYAKNDSKSGAEEDYTITKNVKTVKNISKVLGWSDNDIIVKNNKVSIPEAEMTFTLNNDGSIAVSGPDGDDTYEDIDSYIMNTLTEEDEQKLKKLEQKEENDSKSDKYNNQYQSPLKKSFKNTPEWNAMKDEYEASKNGHSFSDLDAIENWIDRAPWELSRGTFDAVRNRDLSKLDFNDVNNKWPAKAKAQKEFYNKYGDILGKEIDYQTQRNKDYNEFLKSPEFKDYRLSQLMSDEDLDRNTLQDNLSKMFNNKYGYDEGEKAYFHDFDYGEIDQGKRNGFRSTLDTKNDPDWEEKYYRFLDNLPVDKKKTLKRLIGNGDIDIDDIINYVRKNK